MNNLQIYLTTRTKDSNTTRAYTNTSCSWDFFFFFLMPRNNCFQPLTCTKLIERKSKLFVLSKERPFILLLKHLWYHMRSCFGACIKIFWSYFRLVFCFVWPLFPIPHPNPDRQSTTIKCYEGCVAIEETCWNKSVIGRPWGLNRHMFQQTACTWNRFFSDN